MKNTNDTVQFFEGYKLGVRNYETMLREQTDIIINNMNKHLKTLEDELNLKEE